MKNLWGTCFPAGSKVLMADLSWKNIEDVVVGDLMYSVEGNVECKEEHITFLGDRKMLSFQDGSLFWSEEHAFWTLSHSKEWWWSYNPERFIYEVEIGLIGGLKDNSTLRTGVTGLEFAHIQGWKKNDIQVIETSQFNEKTPLFLPLTNGEPIIVNGYLVMSQINEYKVDYTKIKWNKVVAQLADLELVKI